MVITVSFFDKLGKLFNLLQISVIILLLVNFLTKLQDGKYYYSDSHNTILNVYKFILNLIFLNNWAR